MATQRTTFAKLQRDRDKQAKAAAKRERRQNRDGGTEDAPETPHTGAARPAEEVLAEIAQLHERFDAGLIDFDTFEDRKAALLAQLAV
ncbi:MAG: hypothetical protein ACYDA2_03230 [Acidimicrobiales bacterium]